MDPVLSEVNQKIQAALDHLKVELGAIRAGRANPSLIENVTVSAYGGKMKLMEVGTISAPQPNLLTVQIWDAAVVTDVIKSIQEANLGLNPSWEGTTIRLPIPALTEERRQDFIKIAHVKMEESRVQIRQIRQETREAWQREQKAGEFGEDEFNRRSELLQNLVDQINDTITTLGKAKEEELVQI